MIRAFARILLEPPSKVGKRRQQHVIPEATGLRRAHKSVHSGAQVRQQRLQPRALVGVRVVKGLLNLGTVARVAVSVRSGEGARAETRLPETSNPQL